MKPAIEGVNKTQFCCYLYTQDYYELHKRPEGYPCLIFNHFIYLDHKQFMKISHSKLKQNIIKPFNQT